MDTNCLPLLLLLRHFLQIYNYPDMLWLHHMASATKQSINEATNK
jgi:hypothetical protein